MKIVFATKNKGKVNEVVKIFNTDKIELVTMEQAGIDIDVVEDGTTFEENAENAEFTVYLGLKERVLLRIY